MPPDETDVQARAKLELQQLRIEGFQHKIDLLRLMVRERFGPEDQEVLIDRSAKFFEAITGGDFGYTKSYCRHFACQASL